MFMFEDTLDNFWSYNAGHTVTVAAIESERNESKNELHHVLS